MSTAREALRLSDYFPADSIEADGTFSQLDECSSEMGGSLAYCQNHHLLKVALANDHVSAVIAPRRLAREAEGHALVVAEDARLEFFRLYRRLVDEGRMQPDLEPGRGVDCDVHETAVIADLTRIGDRVTIGARAIVLDGSRIGDDTFIAPGAIVGAEGMLTVDDGPRRLRIPHAGGVDIGRNVVILSQAVVARSLFQRFTTIGDEAQIGIHTTIGHGAQIGQRCIIRGSSVISGRAVVEDDAVVSLYSCIADARTVGKGAQVMMGSVVVGNVEAGASVSGNFAYDHREHVNDFIRRTR